MACLIDRTEEGKINGVKTLSGAKSKLFEAIHSNIFLADAETSVKIYNNAFSKKVVDMFEGATTNKYDTGEPQLFYKSSTNKEYDNLEDLLLKEDFGQIEMGFKNPKDNKFVPVAKFTTKGSEKNEFLASKVREGLLSADRVLGEDGITRFKGKGEYTTTRLTTALFVVNDLAAELGNSRANVNKDGTIEIEFNKGLSEVEKPDGSIDVIPSSQIPDYLKNNPDAVNATDLAIEFMVEHDNPRPLTVVSKVVPKKESNLKGIENSLFAFLESLGFSVTSLENYRKSYNTKYGKDPDIQAIADLSNRIVAFANGEIGIEDLSEEVAHIAIEAYSDQESIKKALDNVHMTPEYAEYNEYYRNKYGKFFKGQELEDRVNKEILGKILKKELASRFDRANKTESQNFITNILENIWNWFSNLLSNNFKQYHIRAIQDLNTKIADSIITNNKEDFQTEFETEMNFFYNAMSNDSRTIEEELSGAKRVLEELFNSALGQPTPNQADLDKMVETNGFIDILSSVNTIVGIAENQIDVLAENIAESNRRNELVSTKDSYRYEIIKNNMMPIIESIVSQLRDKATELGINDPLVLKRMDNIISASEQIPVKMSRVSPLMNSDKLKFVDRMLLKMLDHFSLTDEQKAKIRKDLDGTSITDIGIIGKMFGLSSHSKNLAIQLMSVAVTKIATRTNREFARIANKELKDIIDKNQMKYQRSIIHRGKDGKMTKYFLSPRDYEWYDNELEKVQNDTLVRLSNKSLDEIKKLKQKFTAKEILKDEALYDEYQKAVKEWKENTGSERRFTDAYYAERDARYAKANTSKETQDYLSRKNIGRLSRRKKYMNPDGTIDLSKMTDAEKIEDRADFRQHLINKSAYDSSGNLKAGLRRVNVSELTQEEKDKLPFDLDPEYNGDITMLEQGQNIDDLPIDSRRALDLFNLDMVYRAELKDKARTNKPIQQFLDNLREVESRGESAYDWLIANASINLSSDFYENLGTSVTFNDIAQDYVNSITDPQEKSRKQSLLDLLKETQRKRKELLKQNKSPKSTIEVDAKHMTTQVRQTLLELDSEIADIRSSLGIPFELLEELGGLEKMEVDLSDDFQKMLTEKGKSIYEFCLDHMSDKNRLRTLDFANQIEDFLKGKRTYIKRYYDDFLSQMDSEGMFDGLQTTEEIINKVKDEFAKKHVASYFKRYQPEGYGNLLAAMKNGNLKISDIIENKEAFYDQYPALRYLEISPEYSWSEDVNNKDYINPNFKSKGPGIQPKKLNEEFFTRYGISKEAYAALDDEDLSKLTPTKNIEEYDFLVKMTKLREQSLSNYGDPLKGNKYLRPQISKEIVEKILTVHRGGIGTNIKDFFTDLAQSKVDEKEYGEQLEESGINIKVIPKYYQALLEDPSLITENTLEAVLVDLKASIRYKERVNSERDIKAIEYKISQQKFKNKGSNSIVSRILKRGEASNYYEKAQEMADYHLYGIRQNRQMITTLFGREVDLTQLFNRLTTYIRNLNLSYNPLVDLTSLTTGVYNNAIDRIAGDYYHKSSANKANLVVPKMIAEYIAESGKVRKTSKLNHIMEFFGIEQPETKLSQSAQNRAVRLANRSMYAGAKAANLPITPRNAIAILFDFKFHNGVFKSFNNFSRDIRSQQKDISKKEIEALWSKLDDTLYSNLDITEDEGVKYNQKFIDKFGANAEEEFDFISEQVVALANQINQNVDSIISEADQIAAQRDFITNALMLHRGYFIINMTRKFKGKQFNVTTGQFESGYYSDLGKSVRKLFKQKFSKDAAQDMNNILEDFEKKNLVRFAADTIGIAFLIFITNALLTGDDDDDTMLENLAQLIALKTTSETQSQNILGIPGTIAEFYKDPVVQVRNFKDFFKGVYNISDPEKNSKFYNQFLLYKRPRQLSDLQVMVDSYIYFNGEQGNTLLFVNREGFNDPEGSNED